MELSGYLIVARRWWWTLLVATWIAGLVGFVAATRITPTYESRTSLLVGPIQADIDTLRASGQLVQTYAELVTSQPLLGSAIAELGLTMKPSDLRQATRAVANDVTRFLTIRVQSSDPAEAQRIATTLADELVQLASRGTNRPEGELLVADPANVPTSPIAPQVALIALLAAVAGLIGALVVVMLVEYFSNRVRSREDLRRATGRPVLATISLAEVPGAAPIVERNPRGSAAAGYRLLAARLATSDEQTVGIIALTGVEDGDGVGEVALNLALALRQAGRSVVLVDAEGGEAGVSSTIGAGDAIGLAELVDDWRTRPAEALMPYAAISILPPGRTAVPLSLDDASAARIYGSLRERFDTVVVAAGPVAADASALVLARNARVAVLVARRDVARRDAVGLAAETLQQAGSAMAGSILVEGPRRPRSRPLASGSGAARPTPPPGVVLPEGAPPASRATSAPASGPAVTIRPATTQRPAPRRAGDARGETTTPR